MEAQHAIRGTAEMIGIHAPRYITMFLAHLEGVAPILAAAFSTVAIIGMGHILLATIEKIITAKEKAEETKFALQDTWISSTESLRLHTDELALSNAELDVTLAKLSGKPRDLVAVELQTIAVEADKVTQELQRAAKEYEKLTAENAKLADTGAWSVLLSMVKDFGNEFWAAAAKDTISERVKGDIEALQYLTGTAMKKVEEGWDEAKKHAQDYHRSFTLWSEEQLERIGEENDAFNKQELLHRYNKAAIQQITDEILVQQLYQAKYNDLVKELSGDAKEAAKQLALIPTEKIITLKIERKEIQEQEDHAAKVAQEKKKTEENRLASLAIAEAQKFADAKKTIGEAAVTFSEAFAKREYEAGHISLEQELNDLRVAENQKFDALQESFNKKRDLAKREAAIKGESPKGALAAINAGEQAAALEHETKLDDIKANGVKERAKITADAAIADAKNSEALQLSGVEAYNELTRSELALHQITIAQKTEADIAAAQETLHIKTDELTTERNNATGTQEEILKKQKTIDLQKIDLEAKTQLEIQKIRNRGKEQQLAQDAQFMAEEVQFAKTHASLILSITEQADNAKLKQGKIGTNEWLANEIAAVNKWYNAEKAAMDKQLADLKAHDKQNTVEYKRIADEEVNLELQKDQKIEALRQKAQSKLKQELKQMQQMLADTFTQILSGHETWAEGMGKIEDKLLQDMLMNWMTELTELKFHEMKKAVVHAKGSAVSAFHKVFESVPFPANVILAPLAAAAAFAANMAFATFAQGGIVPATGMAKLHEKEMVLPQHIASFILQAAGGNTSTSSSHVTQNFRSNFNNYGGKGAQQSEKDLAKMVRRAARKGYLPLP
jgi:hypothetical protein